MEIDTKANGNFVWNMGREQTNSQMVIVTRASILRVNLMDLANTNGKTLQFMSVNLEPVWNMAKVNGVKEQLPLIAISMKESILLIKSRV